MLEEVFLNVQKETRKSKNLTKDRLEFEDF